MGLKERQLMASLDFSSAKKWIKADFGKDMEFELDKPTFENDEDAILYLVSSGANRIASAISYVCRDNVGKDALSEKDIKKVLFRNLKAEEKKVLEIKSGVLTMASGFGKNNAFSEDELKETLTNML